TETFVAARLCIDSWRWADVPFSIRAGKALAATVTEAVIEFKRPPRLLFADHDLPPEPHHLRFRMNPDDTIPLTMEAKRPGEELVAGRVDLQVAYGERLGGEGPEAYGRLLDDALRGDQRLFARQDQVEAAWAVVDPVLAHPDPVISYERRTWGPAEAAPVTPDDSYWHDWPVIEPRAPAGVATYT